MPRVAILVLVCIWYHSSACTQTRDTSIHRSVTNSSISGFPLAFYLPETGLSAGGLGIYTFRYRQDTTILDRPSSIQIGAAYTSRGQFLLFIPFEIYVHDGAYRVQGELGYYRYQYNFHGLGPSSRSEDLETYDVVFPRVNIQVMKAITERWLLGVGYMYDAFDITRIEHQGILERESPQGAQGGTVSGLLVNLLYDSRNHLFDPRGGTFAEARLSYGMEALGSSFAYWGAEFDIRSYHKLGARLVLAGQLITSYVSDEAPFFRYPYIGSGRLARGLADRRYISSSISSGQAELRLSLAGRFGAVLFTSVSVIAEGFDRMGAATVIPAGGVGLRYVLSRTELTRIRLDYGHSREGGQVYLTINEAF